jgi:hypothetical protein
METALRIAVICFHNRQPLVSRAWLMLQIEFLRRPCDQN